MTMDAAVERIMGEVATKMQEERHALRAAQALPAEPGPCPGSGLRAWSCGGYEAIMCPVCGAAPLGEWPWRKDPDASWPVTPDHDREPAALDGRSR